MKKESIKKRNARYDKATPEQKRVMIARDALKAVNAKRFLATQGSYYEGPRSFASQKPEEVQEGLLNLPTCNVCAKGALFISRIRIGNKITLVAPNCVPDFWPYDNWQLIESFFEGWYLGIKYKEKYPNPTNRLLAILRNIIKNNGLFVP